MASLVKILESAVTVNDLLELLVLNTKNRPLLIVAEVVESGALTMLILDALTLESRVLEFLKACSYNWYCSGPQA